MAKIGAKFYGRIYLWSSHYNFRLFPFIFIAVILPWRPSDIFPLSAADVLSQSQSPHTTYSFLSGQLQPPIDSSSSPPGQIPLEVAITFMWFPRISFCLLHFFLISCLQLVSPFPLSINLKVCLLQVSFLSVVTHANEVAFFFCRKGIVKPCEVLYALSA